MGTVFGITSIILAVPSQSPSGPASSASDGYGLGQGAAGPGRQCTTTAAGALRVIVEDGSIHMSGHAAPSVPIGIKATGGPESVWYGWEAGSTDLTS